MLHIDRTELVAFALDILDIVEERLRLARSQQNERARLLSEAAAAIVFLRQRLERDDPFRLAQLMLVGFFDRNPSDLAGSTEVALIEETDKMLGGVTFARTRVFDRTPRGASVA